MTTVPSCSASADFASTWSKPAACAARSPEVSVWFVKPTIGMSGIRVRDLLRLDARHVRENELGVLRMVGRDETMARQQRLELPPHEQIDPTQQDRRHGGRLERDGGCVQARARGNSRRPLLRGPRGARGRVARGACGGARFLPGARPRRRRVVPGRPRPPVATGAAAREGGAAARALRAAPTAESTSTACSRRSPRRRPASRRARSTSSHPRV